MEIKFMPLRQNGNAVKVNIRILIALVFLLMALLSHQAFSNTVDFTKVNPEELRLNIAQKKIPSVVNAFDNRVKAFKTSISQAKNLTELTQFVIRDGKALFTDAIKQFHSRGILDDRPLYWARLQMVNALKSNPLFVQLLPMQQKKVLWRFELLSRGAEHIHFNKSSRKKILILGFDPLLLDKNIQQSNASGVTALALDDMFISNQGVSAEIESLIIPVRFEGFDQGMIEELLKPYISDIDMLVTLSMGKTAFELTSNAYLKRNKEAFDNVKLTASSGFAVSPQLKNSTLKGPAMIKGSLPVSAMLSAPGKFSMKANINSLTNFDKSVANLKEREKGIKQELYSGAEINHLANELSYRSLLLRDKYNPLLPVGHIITPRINSYQPKKSEQIMLQVKQMLTNALSEI